MGFTTQVHVLANLSPPNHTSILVYPIPHPNHFVAAFLTFQCSLLLTHGLCASHNWLTVATEVAIEGMLSLGPHPGFDTSIFVPNHTLYCPLFSLAKHNCLLSASHFTSALHMLCPIHPTISVGIYPLPVKLPKKSSQADPWIFLCSWPSLQFKDHHLAELRAEVQTSTIPTHITTPPIKTLPFCLWKEDQDCMPNPPCYKWTQDIIPILDLSIPSDLVIGALSLGQCHMVLACLQVFTKHCFCSEYSL